MASIFDKNKKTVRINKPITLESVRVDLYKRASELHRPVTGIAADLGHSGLTLHNLFHSKRVPNRGKLALFINLLNYLYYEN